jgi:hypothetical protein
MFFASDRRFVGERYVRLTDLLYDALRRMASLGLTPTAVLGGILITTSHPLAFRFIYHAPSLIISSQASYRPPTD